MRIRTILLLIIVVILTIALCPMLLVCFPLRIRKPFFAIGKWAMHLAQWILGLPIEVTGLEKVETKATYLFMANHLSLIDGPLLFMLIPQPIRVILKKEAFRIPVIGQAMKHVGFVPVDRKGIRGGKASIDKAARMIKEEGRSFLIFPEGTRSRDGRLQPFKRGGFFLAVLSQVPVVPISIKGTFELMPRKSFFINRGKIIVRFHEPVSVRKYNQDNLSGLMKGVELAIRAGLQGQDSLLEEER
jgi:1-acyl-sn-glycerol-3-phosphate acyltransferase